MRGLSLKKIAFIVCHLSSDTNHQTANSRASSSSRMECVRLIYRCLSESAHDPWPRLSSNLRAFFRWSGLIPAFESWILHENHLFGTVITNNRVILFRSGLSFDCEALKCSACSLCTLKAHLHKIVIAYFLPSMDCRQIRHVLSWNVTLKRWQGTPKVCIFSL